ncbi:MAG TPA: LptE family protein [Fulvivirga sp.]|nr:LptE family protein [Fulvivirga sp.]
MNLKIYRLILSMSLLAIIGGCGVYSFTGVAITAETISIQNFYNEAEGGPPDLAQTFTNKIRDYYQQNTNLALVRDDGELQIEGSVVGYRISPVAATSSGNNQLADLSALTRLTITINVTYINTQDDAFNFENKKYSWYEDYDSNQSLTAVEGDLIDQIYDKIILDIFNASVANW